jgi:hypothetical protein
MPTSESQDLYLALEQAVRTPKERLLVDAFLPPAEAIPSAVQPPAPPRAAAPAPGAGSDEDLLLVRRPEADEAPEPVAPPARRRAKKKTAPEQSLEDEIAEFMSRGAALAPDPDPET